MATIYHLRDFQLSSCLFNRLQNKEIYICIEVPTRYTLIAQHKNSNF